MGHENYHKNLRKIEIMLLLTVTFFLIEMTVGYATKAMVLVTDSFHMLSDVIALLIADISIRLSVKKWSKSTFGWARAEVLGSLINAVFLCALCFSVFIESIKRFYEPEHIKHPKLVLYVGIAGLCVNLIGLFMFIDSHTFDSQKHVIDDSASNMNIRGVFIHILADAVGSIIVVISACIETYSNWRYKKYVDPTLSIVSVCIICLSTWSLLSNSSLILLQTAPAHIDIEALKKQMKANIPELIEIHELHIWQLTSDTIIGTVHILCHNSDDYINIVQKMKQILHELKVHSTTIQPEFIGNKEQVKLDNCLVECPSSQACNTCCDTNEQAK